MHVAMEIFNLQIRIVKSTQNLLSFVFLTLFVLKFSFVKNSATSNNKYNDNRV